MTFYDLLVYVCGRSNFKCNVKWQQPKKIWLYLLKNMHTFAGVPKDLPSRFRPVLDAAETKGLDPQQMNEYITSMLSQSRINASLRAAFSRGEAKGREEIARNMKEMGMSADVILQATGVDLSSIETSCPTNQ